MKQDNKDRITEVYLDEAELSLVELPAGKWFINGKTIELARKDVVQVPENATIQKIHTMTRLKHYASREDSSNILTPTEYEKRKDQIIRKAKTYGTEYNEYFWYNMDDEFEYMKFLRTWDPVRVSYDELSGPLLFNKIYAKLDTGSPYIESLVSTFSRVEELESGIYTYQRFANVYNTIETYFFENDFEFNQNASREETGLRKVWSNATHSGIEYLVAFGSYITPPKWKRLHSSNSFYRGDLETCRQLLKEDRDWWIDHLERLHKYAFGKYSMDESAIRSVISELQHARNMAQEVDVKARSKFTMSPVLAKLDKSIVRLQGTFKIEEVSK